MTVSNTLWLASSIVLWAVVCFLGFLLLGALRAFGILKWQLEQLQATTPSRLGRDGLRVGKKAPAFSLPCANPLAVVARSPQVVARSPDRATVGPVGWSGRETAPQQGDEVSLADF